MPEKSNNSAIRSTVLLALSGVIIVLLCFMFDYTFSNARFHEIAGFVLVGLLCIHFALHSNGFVRISKRVSRLPVQVQLRYVIDIVLGLCVIIIGVTGFFISRALGLWGGNALEWAFRNNTMAPFILVHKITSWILVFFAVAHVALNWGWIRRQLP